MSRVKAKASAALVETKATTHHLSSTATVCIIGAGPSGANCALWLSNLGIDGILVDRRPVGGGLLNDSPYPNNWIVAVNDRTGRCVASEIEQCIQHRGLRFMRATSVLSVHKNSNTNRPAQRFTVLCRDDSGQAQCIDCNFVVIASGVSPRKATQLTAHRDIACGPLELSQMDGVYGADVAILGGGDSAFESYQLLTKRGANRVHIFARSLRAGAALRASVPTFDVSIGDVDVKRENGRIVVNGQSFDRLAILHGWQANLIRAEGFSLAKNTRGFLKVDAHCQTREPGVFAVGEVTQRTHPCSVTAMADGVIAAKAIQRIVESQDHPADAAA